MNPIIKTELLGHIDLSKIIAVRLECLGPNHQRNADAACDGYLIVDAQLRDKPIEKWLKTHFCHRGPSNEIDMSAESFCRLEWEPQIEEQILKPWRAWHDSLAPAQQ